MSYKHFTSDERNELSALIRAGIRQNRIAELLDKSPAAICQEIGRNSFDEKYNAGYAKKQTKERRINANQRFRKLEHNLWLRKYVIKKIKEGIWSPEQITGRLKLKYPDDKQRHIGKDAIYAYVYSKRKDLVKHLRCQKGKYRRQYGTRIREARRKEMEKKRIDTRPLVVESRERIGDWEGDTIVGGEKTIHILTHVERRSGILFADKLERATAELTKEKTIKRFEKISRDKKYTITYDNGTTFAEHEMTEKETGMDIYFAYPYHSWERGTNENTNGLLRQFFPKKSMLANITQETIEIAVKLINNRPRKRLNYFTPREVFYGKE